MPCTRHVSQSPAASRANRVLRQTLCGIALLCCTVPTQAAEQDDSLHPRDIDHLRRETHFTSNWSDSDQFDLASPFEIEVNLLGFRVPELSGTAEVLFTLNLPTEVLAQGQFEVDHVFYATVQTAGEFKNLKLNTRSFSRDGKALLRGWPPSEGNLTASLMLVDEMELSRNGRLISFHRKHPKMKKKPKGGKPGNSPE